LIENNILYNNAAYGGGGIAVLGSVATITNNTICENQCYKKGAGIWFQSASGAILTNTIVRDNYAAFDPDISVDGTAPPVTYCNIEGGWPGTGNIDKDPLFVDQANGDYHIPYTSPCKDAGDNAAITEPTDFEGDPRIAWSGTVDMGADEFYTHLYCTGDFTPGGSIEGKLVGLPGTSPVGLFLGSGVLDPPVPTMWGYFHLQAPWFLIPLIPIPGDGVLVLPATIPATPPAPYDLPMQALIGLNPDSLTNLYVLNVR
jgi:parallel beta-helix repeat protein